MQKIIGIIVFMLVIPLFSQAQYRISGTVKEAATGKPLSGAYVVLENTRYITVTDETGRFAINDVKPGIYRLKASFVGFDSYLKEIKLSGDLHLDINLKEAAYMSDEVIISALRAGDKTPATYQTLKGTYIAKYNTGKDLPFLLKLTPSVVVTSDAGAGIGYTSLRIRGVDLTGINVTLNGVPVNDPESQAVYFVDLPDLAASVDNIQIQRGVGTSTNGAAAFGASINIKTDAFNPMPYATLSSTAGSFNTFKNSLKFGTGILGNHWLINGRISYIHSDGFIDRAFSDLRSGYLSAGYYGKKDIVKVIGMWGHERTYQAWYGVPKDSLATNRTYNPAGAIYDNEGNFLGYYKNQTDNYTQNYYQLHYAHTFTKSLNLAAALFLTRGYGYYESYKNNQKFSKYGMADTIIGTDTVSRTNLIRQKWLDNYFYGFNLAVNYEKRQLKISAGGGRNNYDGDHFGKIIWAQVARLGDYDRNWYFNTGTKREYNVFLKANYLINERLNLMADLQYRNIDYAIKGTHDDLRDLTQEHTFGFFNPKAGIFYEINKRNHAYFSFSVANREPNRSVYRDADPNQIVKPERLFDYELGYKFSTKPVVLHANLYYMKYKDQLVLTGKINNVGTPVMTNVPDSYRAGVEFSGKWNIGNHLAWEVNTTLSRNKILNFIGYVDNWDYWNDPDNEPYQYEENLGNTDISFSPSVLATSIITWSGVKNLNVNWVSKYVGRQYIDNTSNTNRSLDPYWVNNLNVSYALFPAFMKEIDFTLQLNNLLNEQYETNAWVYRYYYGGSEYEMNGYFPQAGFNFMAGIVVRM